VNRAAVAWWWLADWAYALRWQLRSLRRGSPPQDGPPAPGCRDVVLVPGVYESWRFLAPLTEALRGAGHAVHAVEALAFQRASISDGADLVRAFAAERGLRGAVLVAHSKGGLVGKLLLVQDAESGALGGHEARFERLVAVNTPFAGSSLARWVPVLRSVRAFRPGDPLLVRLAAAHGADDRITAVRSAVDPTTPRPRDLPGARNVRLDAVGHFRVLSDPDLHRAVLDALR
jgi:alpha-beta hydrolase superfamily lysophospholipase